MTLPPIPVVASLQAARPIGLLMPRYRILALDIDGTLVNSRDEVTSGVRQALQRAVAAGIRLILATGRRYSRALPLAQALEIDAPIVSASGALIKRPADHATLYRAEFAPGVLAATLQIIQERGFQAVVYADTFAQGFDFYCEASETDQPELADYLALNPGCHVPWPGLHATPPPGVFAGFATGTRSQMLELHEQLQAALPGMLYTHVLRSPRYIGYMCEIAPASVTKWSGVQQVAAAWGVAAAEMCCVGDDVNDLPMIQGAGLGVAMGNAVPEVQAAADRIAPPHDADGLAQVVAWLLEDDT